MIGGTIQGVFRFDDRLSLAVRGTDIERNNWVAIDLPLDAPPVRERDSIWWQGHIALWTPQDGSAQDVHIPRIGYSYDIEDLWLPVTERCRAGICPECANPETMHDGEGALWCGNCGASWMAPPIANEARA